MTSGTASSAASLDSDQRAWLVKMGAALKVSITSSPDVSPSLGGPAPKASDGKSAGNAPANAAAGANGAASNADAAKFQKELLKVGSKGPAVEFLQKTLGGSLKSDGSFGQSTKTAVQAFQKGKGLKVDGVVGPKTWAALAGGAVTPASGAAGGAPGAAAGAAKSGAKFITAAVGKGCKNLPEDVKAVQIALKEKNGANLPADGNYTPQVQKAIEEFQQRLGQFKPDGIIQPGRGTARALSGAGKIPPTPAKPNPIAPPTLGKATLDKGAFVWHSTREILKTNIEELKKGVLAVYGTEHDDLLKAIDASMAHLNKVVDKLDTRLADSLDAAYKAKDDQSRVAELKKAQGIMNEYLAYVKEEPLIDHMDDNPFGVKTSLKKVITDAIQHLSQLLPEPVPAGV
jgi:peptidoglycan hydrolase-like protein with peptidoglycan-binding domain